MTEYERQSLNEQRLTRRQEARQHMERQRTLLVTCFGALLVSAAVEAAKLLA